MTANRILQMNGLATGATAIAMLGARQILYPIFGLTSPLLLDVIAIAFLGYAAALLAVARQPRVGRGALLVFSASDALWVVVSVVAVIAFWSEMTAIGRALIAVTAIVVEIFATLQFRAARTDANRSAFA